MLLLLQLSLRLSRVESCPDAVAALREKYRLKLDVIQASSSSFISPQ